MNRPEFLAELLDLCTPEQLAMHKKMYPNGVTTKELNWAITQVKNTIKNLNLKCQKQTEELANLKQEVLGGDIIMNDITFINAKLTRELREKNALIERLSTPEAIDNAEVQEQLAWLSALEDAGVDNWSGYEYAQEIFNGERS